MAQYPEKRWFTGMTAQEDWWAVWLGMFFFALGLLSILGVDLVGWSTYPTKWVASVPEGGKGEISKAFYALGKKYSFKGEWKAFYKTLGWSSILWTYVIWTIATCIGAASMKWNVKRFFMGWTIIFFLTIGVWFIGHHAFFATSAKPKSIKITKAISIGIPNVAIPGKYKIPDELKNLVDDETRMTSTATALKIVGKKGKVRVKDFERYGLSWSLSLGGGASFILALIVGLLIGNFVKPLARFLSEAAKPEWYIKTAIVFLGVKVGYLPIKAAAKSIKLGKAVAELTGDLFLAGAAATIVAYLIFWPGIYLIARKMFNLPRKTAAVLGSAISICGVSAAVATGGAVKAKPVVSIMVASLVVVWAVIELVILPPFFTYVWPKTDDPLVAGAAMGMAVKTDGADAAAGEIMDELMRAEIGRVSNYTIEWPAGVITTSAVMTKVWIDMFIGLWAFVLAMVWVYRIDRRPGERVPVSEVWHRFPKFVLGYFVAWFVYLGIFFGPGGGGTEMAILKDAKVGAVPVEKGMRKLMFMLTFMSLGIITDFGKLAEAKFGKMVWVYAFALFVFVIPVAIIVAYLFHHGMEIPNIAPPPAPPIPPEVLVPPVPAP